MPKVATKVLCTCNGCGQQFYRNASQVARGRDKYCTQSCYQATHSNRVAITCKIGGRTTTVP